MPLRDDLLTAIPGPNPSGADLRYDPSYDKIKEARREDAELPQGAWQTERKTADYTLVVKLASDLLATKTKDLQVAAWLTEALLKRDGVRGLREGLALLRSLIAQYWDSLHPALEDGDPELRFGPLAWVGGKLGLSVRLTPLNGAGHNVLQYLQSRAIPTDEEAKADSAKRKTREAELAEGKLAPEEFDKSVDETPKAWYKALVADLAGCLEELSTLDAVSTERFPDESPSFTSLAAALTEVQAAARQLLNKKLELDPDPPAAEPEVADAGMEEGAPASSAAAAEPAAARTTLDLEPADRNDAASRVIVAARFLRRTEPHSPASYLMLRGLRWGELRARGADVDPRLLEAPPTNVRSRLKGLLLDGKWAELLEVAEGVMGTPQGRGWLDLQRYVLTACAELGAAYDFVATAVRSELRALLLAVPDLPTMTLMDDTPTANAETQAWLHAEALTPGAAVAGTAGAAGAPLATEWGGRDGNGTSGGLAPSAGRTAYHRATVELKSGRADRAIDILMQELNRERSPRGRFIRMTQVASIMVDAGLESVAMPILDELLEQIEAHKLEEWEPGEVVAQPLMLLCRCIDKLDGDAGQRQKLYLRVCRLDPLQALATPAR